MKRLYLFIVVCSLLCSCEKTAAQGIVRYPADPPGTVASVGAADVGAANAADTEIPADTTVYITNSGRRYHRENCSSLRNSRVPVTLADAVKSAYTACSICNPPRHPFQNPPLEGASARGESAGEGPAAFYRVNLAKSDNSAAVDFSQLLPAEVTSHVDGDTIKVQIRNPPAGLKALETIRLIGVDTPETVHPRREVETFGKEASDFTKNRLLGKTVYLAFDWDLRDRYGRLLAYVYTQADGNPRCHNAELIRQGYGHAYTRFSFQFLEEFRTLEKEARENKRGLWG
ncbi:hypothetical protein AGMMS50230_07280 [Spirochaetia bacterium]|nr:hypothetical protein AGMMS50230_07280 [Spirochaetia bacterium]